MSNLFITSGIQTGKMLSFAGTILQMLGRTTALCALKSSAKKRRVDAVFGIVSAVVSRTVLFQLVYNLDYFY